jgi:predicted nucleotidyltransferase/uncharacterized protein (UPF0332 family)
MSDIPVADAQADPTRHPAMRRFAAAVRALYGDRVERIVLFGSRARGDAREDSDWDVAVFVSGHDRAEIRSGRLADITTEILLDSDQEINPAILSADTYDARTAFMREVRREGLDLIPRTGTSAVDTRVKSGHDDSATISGNPSSPGLTRRSTGGPAVPLGPEVADLLRRTRVRLDGAQEILARTHLHAVVAREAYDAVLWAARAVLLGLTDRVVPKHRRVRDEIRRLADLDPLVGYEFATFLQEWFDAVVVTEYGVERGRDISRAMADDAVATAAHLVAHAEWLLAQPEPPPAA